MTDTKKKSKLQITNALMWAAVMIGTALLVTGEMDMNDQGTLMMIHIIGWYSVDAAIRKNKKNCSTDS